MYKTKTKTETKRTHPTRERETKRRPPLFFDTKTNPSTPHISPPHESTMSAFTLSAARQTLRIAPSSTRRASATRRSTTVRAMAKQIISTDKAPSALGPYNQAVKVRDDEPTKSFRGDVPY